MVSLGNTVSATSGHFAAEMMALVAYLPNLVKYKEFGLYSPHSFSEMEHLTQQLCFEPCE